MIIPFPYPINAIIVSLLNVLGISLALWVYWANRANNVNKGFSLMVFFILGWVNSYYFAQYSNSVFWFRTFASSVFLFFIAYYFFIVRWFLQKSGLYKIFGRFVLSYGILFSILSFTTDLIIINFDAMDGLSARPIFNSIGWWLFYIYAIILTILINWTLIKEYFNYSSDRKIKVLYFLVGFLISGILNFVFNVMLPVLSSDYRFYEFGNYSIFFLLGFVSYAIVRHSLFDIKILLSQILIFVIWSFVIVRTILSSNENELIVNILLVILILIAGSLLLKSISREKFLAEELLDKTKKNLNLEKQLREKITKKANEMIRKMEDIVKE